MNNRYSKSQNNSMNKILNSEIIELIAKVQSIPKETAVNLLQAKGKLIKDEMGVLRVGYKK